MKLNHRTRLFHVYVGRVNYRVTLTEQERKAPEDLTRSGKTGAKKFINARALLLLCDACPGSPAWTVAKVAEALGVTSRTIEHLI